MYNAALDTPKVTLMMSHYVAFTTFFIRNFYKQAMGEFGRRGHSPYRENVLEAIYIVASWEIQNSILLEHFPQDLKLSKSQPLMQNSSTSLSFNFKLCLKRRI